MKIQTDIKAGYSAEQMDALCIEIPELRPPTERSTRREESVGRLTMKTGFSVSAILE